MISVSRKLLHAMEAVLYIAYASGHHPVSSKDISDAQGMPPRYLEQIMQKLVRAGILRGIRGPRGGYLLARERRRITLGEIASALGGDEDDDKKGLSSPLGVAVIVPLWQKLDAGMQQELNGITLADLCDQAYARHIRRPNDARMDFNI